MRLALVRVGLWVSLMVAAVGVWLVTDQVGAGLLAAGVASAAVLFFVVDTETPSATVHELPQREQRERRGLVR